MGVDWSLVAIEDKFWLEYDKSILLQPMIVDWLNTHIGKPEWIDGECVFYWLIDWTANTLCPSLKFRRAKDAVLFKLTWV
jgi:hypothetical protein